MVILNKVYASTIIEVISASIIITMTFSLSLLIILNLYKSNLLYQKIEAQILLANILYEDNEYIKNFINKKHGRNDIWIEEKIINKNIAIVIKNYSAYNKSGKLLAKRNIIISNEN